MPKKTFKTNLEKIGNPALQFISSISSDESYRSKPPEDVIPEGFKIVPEAKSKRLQLLIQPSLYDRIKLRAKQNKTSVNETIHKILNEAFKKN